MKVWYEYQMGVYIEADSEQEAHSKIVPVMNMLRGLDAEDSPSLDGPFVTYVEEDDE